MLINWTLESTPSPLTVFEVDLQVMGNFFVAKYVLYVLSFFLSIAGNIAVIFIICSRRKIRKGSYVLLVLNLAICDLITPTLSIPFDWAYEEFDHKWIFGKALCKLLWPLQTLFSTSSSLTLTMICYDRYRAVVHPFKALRITKTHIKRCIFATHFISFMMTLPYFAVLKLERDECTEKWPYPVSYYRKAYTLALFLAQYGIPLVLMITLHSLAVKNLCLQSDDTEFLRGRSRSAISRESESSNISVSSQQSTNRRFIQLKKEQNASVTKMFVVVVLVFALSTFPNQVLWLWVDFGQGTNNKYFPLISVVCRLFTYSNSVFNPIIYGFFSREFRPGKTKIKRTIPDKNSRSTISRKIKKSSEESQSLRA